MFLSLVSGSFGGYKSFKKLRKSGGVVVCLKDTIHEVLSLIPPEPTFQTIKLKETKEFIVIVQ